MRKMKPASSGALDEWANSGGTPTKPRIFAPTPQPSPPKSRKRNPVNPGAKGRANARSRGGNAYGPGGKPKGPQVVATPYPSSEGGVSSDKPMARKGPRKSMVGRRRSAGRGGR